MSDSTPSTPSRDKVRVHRARLPRQGLRPIQIWVPDVQAPTISGGRPPAITRGRQQRAVVRTKRSSRPSRTGMTDEARGDLDGLGRPELRREGPPRRDPPRRQLQRHRLHHDLRLHDRSHRRAPVPPTDRHPADNGLRSPSRRMVDKITTVSKDKVGKTNRAAEPRGYRAVEPSDRRLPRAGHVAEDGHVNARTGRRPSRQREG